MGNDLVRRVADNPAVGRVLKEFISFSKDYEPFFRNCGLYVVGSSLTSNHPRDIDLVLAGLDFRAVAEYDKVFLRDPETLIEKRIVIPPQEARRLGTRSPFGIMCIPLEGAVQNSPQIPDAPDEDAGNMEDLGDIDNFMLSGIEHKGRKYCFNIQQSMATSTALNLDNYCIRQGQLSNLTKELYERINALSIDPAEYKENLYHPFEPYFHNDEFFLTVNFPIKTSGIPIHFIIHSENLHVNSWKRYQNVINYPFIPLYEGPDADKIVERPILTHLPLPDCMDPAGEERIKPSFPFCFLKDPPING